MNKKDEPKKILIVSRSFYPMISPRSFRTTELVKEFARQGHDVTLYTLKNEEYHADFEDEFGIQIKDLGKLRFNSIQTSGGNTISVLIRRVLRRVLSLLLEYPDIELMWNVRSVLKNESGYDLLITVAVPHPIHWGAAWAYREENPIAKIWVADCGDPYMGATLDTFKKMFYFKYLEKAFCRKADYITVPIEEAIDGYYPEFRDKIMVIPQGFKFGDVDINPEGYQDNQVPTFAYAGGLIPGGRDPGKFLNYLVNQEKKYKFVLYTKSTSLVEPYQEKANGNIEIRDYIPREELLQELSNMDFLVNFENSTSLQLPSKLIDYYLTGRPVLSVHSDEIDEATIDQFLNRNYQARFKYENVDQYRIENVCQQFLNLCN